MPDDAGEKKPSATESLAGERATLKERVDAGGSEADRLAKEADDEIGKVSEQLAADGEAIKNYHVENSRETIAGLAQLRSQITRTLYKSSYSLSVYLWSQIILLSLLGLLGGYLTFQINQGLFGGFVAAWLVISAIVVSEVRSQLRRIAQHSSDVGSDVDNLNKKITSEAAGYPVPKNDTTAVGRIFSMLRDDIGQIVTAAGSFLPFLEKYEKAIALDQFVDKFSFALKKYDFDSYSLDARRSFVGKIQIAQNETLWLAGLSEASSDLWGGKPAVIFRLMYYETWDRDNISATWAEIRGDSKERSSLRESLADILLTHNLVDTQGLGRNAAVPLTDILFGMEDYSLSELRARANGFFRDLSQLKTRCLDVLDSYDLGLIIQKDLVTNLSPKSSNPKDWQNEVIEFVAEQTHKKTLVEVEQLPDGLGQAHRSATETGLPPFTAEKLVLVEGIGDASRESLWQAILNSESSDFLIGYLASVLTKKRVPKLHNEFPQEVFLGHLALVMKASKDDFRLERIEEELEMVEQEILRTKRGIMRTNDRMHFGLNDVAFADAYVPSSIFGIEEGLVKKFAEAAKVDLEVTRLLYFLTVGSDKSAEIFRLMVGSQNLKPLADFLVSRGFVPKRQFNEFLPALLAAQSSFEFVSFLQSYNRYEKLTSKLGPFLGFLERHLIARISNLPSFDDILKTSAPGDDLEFPDLFFQIAVTMVSTKLDGITLTGQQHSELSKAACALSLSLDNDRASEKLAEDLYWETFGAHVLFAYSKLYVANITKEKATLKEAAVQTATGQTADPNFAFYREKLHAGLVIFSEDVLLSMRRNEFESILKRNEKLGLENELLQNYETSIKEFMRKVDVNVAREFLSAGVFSAYLLTIPHSTALVAFMDEHGDAIDDAEKSLARNEKDQRYFSLRQYETGSGAGTRIGLVPYGMTFEEFALMFEKLFGKAKEISKTTKNLNFYVTRIFPSSDALREIMQAGPVNKPLEVVRDLVRKYVSGTEALSVLSLLEPNENSPTAFNTVISALIDSKSNNLLTLTQDLASDIVNQNSEVENAFRSGGVDSALRSSYDAKTLTELCKKIEASAKLTSVDSVKAEFGERFLGILPAITRLPPDTQGRLIGALFRRMYVVGTVLNS